MMKVVLMCAPSGQCHVIPDMMKVVLMCAPSGQCQVLHDESSLNVYLHQEHTLRLPSSCNTIRTLS